ncbi:MAG: hypothetical protein FWG65_00680 [Turicibacter sp.]|nr:hypothetical protein [Turicibacter sp.]
MKNLYSLPEGFTFKALILDIRPGKVTIKLEGGDRFTARSLVLPDARIYEESYFRVKSNDFKGLVQLEMIKAPPEERQASIVQEALQNAGLHNVPDNVHLGKVLIENNLPLNAETFQKMAFFSQGQAKDMEKAVFLIKEGFSTDLSNVKTLENILDPNMHMGLLLDGIMPNLDLESHNLTPLNEFYRELSETLQQLKKTVTEQTDTADILQKLDILRENLDFMRRVSKQTKYFQIPFTHKGKRRCGELFKYDSGQLVVGLDTEHFGRIEVGLDKALNLQFEAKEHKTLTLIEAQSSFLVKELYQRGFTVASIKYRKKDSRTTILSTDPKKLTPSPQNYSFDMRI